MVGHSELNQSWSVLKGCQTSGEYEHCVQNLQTNVRMSLLIEKYSSTFPCHSDMEAANRIVTELTFAFLS